MPVRPSFKYGVVRSVSVENVLVFNLCRAVRIYEICFFDLYFLSFVFDFRPVRKRYGFAVIIQIGQFGTTYERLFGIGNVCAAKTYGKPRKNNEQYREQRRNVIFCFFRHHFYSLIPPNEIFPMILSLKITNIINIGNASIIHAETEWGTSLIFIPDGGSIATRYTP